MGARHLLTRRPRRSLAALAALSLAGGIMAYPLSTPTRAAAASGSLPAGTGFSLSIDGPADNTVIPPGPVTVTGSASVQKGTGTPNTAAIYVLDLGDRSNKDSGTFHGECSGQNTRLDCQKSYVPELNDAAIDGGGVPKSGLVGYAGRGGFIAFVTPNRGTLTSPSANSTGEFREDIEHVGFSAIAHEAADTTVVSGFLEFSPGVIEVDDAVSDSADGLRMALQLAAESGMPNVVMVYMASGAVTNVPNFNGVVDTIPANVHVYPVVIGARDTCDATYLALANRTGGTCSTPKNQFTGGGTNVVDGPFGIGDAPDVLANLLASRMNSLTVSVDGGAATPVGSVTGASLPARGPVNVTYSTTVPNLPPGRHSICVNLNAHDSGGNGSLSECRTVTVNQPPTAATGGPYAGVQDQNIDISGTASDPDKDDLRTQWAISAGEGVDPAASCTIVDAAALNTTIKCNRPGTYALSLTADDGITPPVTANTTVTITNVAPIISAGGPYQGVAGMPVALTGTLIDPDSPNATVLWSVTPPPSTGESADPGNGTGDDPDGGTSDDPDGGTSDDPGNGTSDDPGNGTSDDPDGPGDPQTPAPCTFTDPAALQTVITCPTPGDYTLTLTVNDGDNTPATATAPLTITEVPTDPTDPGDPTGSLSLSVVRPQVGFVGGAAIPVTYTIRNNGTVPMTDVRLATAFPAALSRLTPGSATQAPPGASCQANRTCAFGTLQPGQQKTVTFAVRPTAAADGTITATLTTTGKDATAADNKATARVVIKQPTLTVDPSAGPTGLVVHAVGRDFPAGARIRLAWSIGLSQLPGEVVVGRDGTVDAQMLIFNHDQEGARELVATTVAGARFAPVKSSTFLVSARPLEPPLGRP
jgi:uncharacterized protein DUF11